MAENENQKLLNDINQKVFHIENAYLVRREVYLHFNKAVNADAAEAYLKVITSHKGFFLPLLEGALSYTMNNLNRLVSSNDKKSLEKVINKMQAAGEGNFTADLEKLRQKHNTTLKTITELRMDYFAHLGDVDLKTINTVSEDDYIKLFEDVKDLVNKLNNVYGNTVWYMDGDAREAIKDTHDLMNNLLRGEASRISEIDVEYISGVFSDGKSKWLKSAE
ncbi:MAG TPA: hypothetical protein VF575_03275 [Candidatus Saccharimonadales bacterium]|jgi:hypothetical protein